MVTQRRIETSQCEVLSPTPCVLGESPLWHQSKQTLYWLDIIQQTLFSWQQGQHQQLPLSVMPTALAIHQGALTLATAKGLGTVNPEQGVYQINLDFSHLPHRVRFNDGVCDSAGRFWVGTMDTVKPRQAIASLYCYADGQIIEKKTGLTVSNGVGFSPCEKWFYHVDSGCGLVHRYRYDAASGTLHAPSPWIEIPRSLGVPDGLTVDDGGNLWLAIYYAGQVQQFDSEGQLQQVWHLPVSCPTNCCFIEEDCLVVTSAAQSLSQPGPLDGHVVALTTA